MAKQQFIFPDGEDPYRFVARVFYNKWDPMILTAIYFEGGTARYSRFIHGFPISEKVLAENLRQLISDGLITRTAYAEVPPRVEYSLTELGRSTIPLLFALYDWGYEEMKRRGMKIDKRGAMYHSKLPRDPAITDIPMRDYLHLLMEEESAEAAAENDSVGE